MYRINVIHILFKEDSPWNKLKIKPVIWDQTLGTEMPPRFRLPKSLHILKLIIGLLSP